MYDTCVIQLGKHALTALRSVIQDNNNNDTMRKKYTRVLLKTFISFKQKQHKKQQHKEQ